MSVSLTLPTGKTNKVRTAELGCVLPLPLTGKSPGWMGTPLGSAGGPGLVSALLQSHGGAVTPAQPPGQENCFLCAQEAPHDGAAVLIPSAMWLCSPLLPAFQVPDLYVAAMAGALQEGLLQLVLVLTVLWYSLLANWYCPDHAV